MLGGSLIGITEPFKCGKLPSVPTGPLPNSCVLRANGCMCSSGCQSTFACRPSALCSQLAAGPRSRDVPILMFLHFNRTHVRHKHSRRPMQAYEREVNRLVWLLRSAQRVGTSLPLHVVVAGDRNASAEDRLRQHGATITESTTVDAPRWSSSFHKFSFSRIAALAMTQFRKVIVIDNDMTLIGNIDDLADAEAPAMVWHTATVLPKKERCAPTGGLFVLEPSATEFAKALQHLTVLNRKTASAGSFSGGVRCYDGSDQEFWRSFYRPMYELPLRYHAHNGLVMNSSEWNQIRLMHNIAGFKVHQRRLPKSLRKQVRYFTGDGTDQARLQFNVTGE